MPYYNTFHKVYTGVFNIKTDVALTVFKEVDLERGIFVSLIEGMLD